MVRDNAAVGHADLWPALGQYLGQALQVARILAGMSQENLAEALKAELGGRNVRQSYVSRVEKGRCSISWQRFGVFCKLLTIAPSEVVRLAESIAEDETVNEDELLRNLHAIVARELVEKPNCSSNNQQELLRAIHSEVKRRLGLLGRRGRRSPSTNGKQLNR